MVLDIIQRGITLWEGVVTASSVPDPENTLGLKTEPGPLCGFCNYLATCRAFHGDTLPDELTGLFRNYLDLCRTEKAKENDSDDTTALIVQAVAVVVGFLVALWRSSSNDKE